MKTKVKQLKKDAGWIVAVKIKRAKAHCFIFSDKRDAIKFEIFAQRYGATTDIFKARAA